MINKHRLHAPGIGALYTKFTAIISDSFFIMLSNTDHYYYYILHINIIKITFFYGER